MIIIVKLLSIILGLMVISKTYHDFRKSRESITMFLFWTIAWIGIIFVSLFPEIVDEIISLSQGQRIGTGTFFGIAIIFLFFVIYRIYIKADRIERDLAEVVRQVAIKKTSSINRRKK
ncbi:MAG: DUF2304 domain-containing protein [Patescibacteria group bacterium]